MVTVAEELPFAAVVENEYMATSCSACFSTEGNKSRCIGCKIVHYCNNICQNEDWLDHKRECSFLKNFCSQVPPSRCRLMARIAIKLKRPDAKEPAFNGRVYDDLMDRMYSQKKDTGRMKIFLAFSQVLRLYMGDKVPDTDLLFSIFGKIEINSFVKGQSGLGLYLGFSVHDHSCTPEVYMVNCGRKALLRSTDPNKKYSKDLTVSYTDPLRTNEDRQRGLRAAYYFTCTCARCSDPTLEFLYNSARSTCCPDSYCLLNPDVEEMTCNKCGSISGITVKEAMFANWKVKAFSDDSQTTIFSSEMTFDVPTLVETYEKFSKILSPLNLNLLLLNDRLVLDAYRLKNNNPVSRKYVEHLLPAHKQYWSIGVFKFPVHLQILATTMAFESPPTVKVLEVIEKALSITEGPQHSRTLSLSHLLYLYRERLEWYTIHGEDLLMVEA